MKLLYAIAIILGAQAYKAFIIMTTWNWLAVPIWQVKPWNFWVAAAASLVVFAFKTWNSTGKVPSGKFTEAIVAEVLTGAIILALAYIVKINL